MTADRRPLRVVLAPDKFKGTLTAAEAAEAMAAGVRSVLPDAAIQVLPVADGGEGTLEALVAAGATGHHAVVHGPLGDHVEARFASSGGTAFVEAAQACGLMLLSPTPVTALRASSFGVGELVLAALDLGLREVVVGLGGVATTDGGAGMLAALGGRAARPARLPLDGGGGVLGRLRDLDLSGLDARIVETRFVVATDVSNPLTGPDGAAVVYGPQKGAGPAEVAMLAAGLENYASVLELATGRDVSGVAGAGAAGGLGAALVAALGAEVRSGVELLLDWVGAAQAVSGADLVITGEGSLDRQSLQGKAPLGVAGLAREHRVPVIAVAGRLEGGTREALASWFDATWSLTEEVGRRGALKDAGAALQEVTRRAVQHWGRTRDRA